MHIRTWFFRGLSLLALAVVVAIVQGCGQQQETAKAPEAPPEGTEATALATSLVSGEVVSVDPQANIVEVQDATGTKWVFGIDPSTTITEDGRTLPLDALTAGRMVDVLHEPGSAQPGETLMAKAITVKP